MSRLGRVVVGYRPGDRRIRRAEDQGEAVRTTTRCAAGCGYPVLFTVSGYDAARYRDAEVICDNCYQENKAEIQEAL